MVSKLIHVSKMGPWSNFTQASMWLHFLWDREILLNPIYIKRGPAMDTEFWFSQPRALEKQS